jgi:hypothetical protein
MRLNPQSSLYRRLLHDDGKGVAEALNETVCLDKQCEGLIVSKKDYFLDTILDRSSSQLFTRCIGISRGEATVCVSGALAPGKKAQLVRNSILTM